MLCIYIIHTHTYTHTTKKRIYFLLIACTFENAITLHPEFRGFLNFRNKEFTICSTCFQILEEIAGSIIEHYSLKIRPLLHWAGSKKIWRCLCEVDFLQTRSIGYLYKWFKKFRSSNTRYTMKWSTTNADSWLWLIKWKPNIANCSVSFAMLFS